MLIVQLLGARWRCLTFSRTVKASYIKVRLKTLLFFKVRCQIVEALPEEMQRTQFEASRRDAVR